MSPPAAAHVAGLAAARTIADFVRNPADRYVARRCFCFWQIGGHTKGVVAWGSPEVADAREMVAAFEAGARPHETHVSLVDMRCLRAVDAAAFDVVMTYMTRRQPVFEKTVLRQALMHGADAVGAAVGGFYAVVPARYPVATFTELGPALEWLRPHDPARTARVVEALRARYGQSPEIVSRIRGTWAPYAAPPSLTKSARLLGMSPRSLQRALELAGTSFRDQLTRERLARAESLLASTTLSIKAVAAAVELSAGRLSSLFRRAHGVGPTEWRERGRARHAAGAVMLTAGGRAPRSSRLGSRGR